MLIYKKTRTKRKYNIINIIMLLVTLTIFFIIKCVFRVIETNPIMPTEISKSKTICILAIVVGCFAVLWPSLFYPMLKGSFAPQTHTGKLIYFTNM